MKLKNRIFTFGAVLFSLLLTNSNLAQSQVSPTTVSPSEQSSTTDGSQSHEVNWIGLAGTIVAVFGVGFGFFQLQNSKKLEQEKLELQQRLEQEKLESQQRLEQEKLASQQQLEQEKLASQQQLEQEKLASQQQLEQEKLESQQQLEQEKLAWECEKLTLEDETLQLKSDLKVEQQRQLHEAEAEEAAKRESEAEAIADRSIEEETEVYCEKVLADLRNEKIMELKKQNLNHANYQ